MSSKSYTIDTQLQLTADKSTIHSSLIHRVRHEHTLDEIFSAALEQLRPDNLSLLPMPLVGANRN